MVKAISRSTGYEVQWQLPQNQCLAFGSLLSPTQLKWNQQIQWSHATTYWQVSLRVCKHPLQVNWRLLLFCMTTSSTDIHASGVKYLHLKQMSMFSSMTPSTMFSGFTSISCSSMRCLGFMTAKCTTSLLMSHPKRTIYNTVYGDMCIYVHVLESVLESVIVSQMYILCMYLIRVYIHFRRWATVTTYYWDSMCIHALVCTL